MVCFGNLVHDLRAYAADPDYLHLLQQDRELFSTDALPSIDSLEVAIAVLGPSSDRVRAYVSDHTATCAYCSSELERAAKETDRMWEDIFARINF